MKISALSIIIGLVIGLAAGYYWGKSASGKSGLTDSMGFNDAQKAQIEKLYSDSSFSLVTDPNRGSRPISNATARRLMQEFQNQNGGSIFRLRNIDQKPLKGYFIDRGPLDEILKDKSWDGVSVYFAKDSTASIKYPSRRIYTLVYMGGRYLDKQVKKDITNDRLIPRTLRVGTEDTLGFDFVKPCPDACGGFLGGRVNAPNAKKSKN